MVLVTPNSVAVAVLLEKATESDHLTVIAAVQVVVVVDVPAWTSLTKPAASILGLAASILCSPLEPITMIKKRTRLLGIFDLLDIASIPVYLPPDLPVLSPCMH